MERVNDFIIVEDTRNQIKKHEYKHKYWDRIGQKYIRSKLYVGDYSRLDKSILCIDTKKDLTEVAKNICGGKAEHTRFINELVRAQECGIKLIILVESSYTRETAWGWSSKYTKITGQTLMKAIMTIEKKYNTEFVFCKKTEAPKKIIELLSK